MFVERERMFSHLNLYSDFDVEYKLLNNERFGPNIIMSLYFLDVHVES